MGDTWMDAWSADRCADKVITGWRLCCTCMYGKQMNARMYVKCTNACVNGGSQVGQKQSDRSAGTRPFH